jgi:hypothetical protein
MAGWGARILVSFGGVAVAAACSAGGKPDGFFSGGPSDDGGGSGSGTGTGTGGTAGDDSSLPLPGDDSSVSIFGDGAISEGGTFTGDPVTCAQAQASHSYIGCDYWPTVLANAVWSIFDYAVVVANAGTAPANITVTGPGGTNQTATVAPGGLTKIYLPWVSTLKATESDNCGGSNPLMASIFAQGSAYHLVSTVPVTVYQFNALEYKGAGGPAGKSWAACPGNSTCTNPASPNYGARTGCFSFSNDASLLLPSTAMTGNYRAMGNAGTTFTYRRQSYSYPGGYIAITAIQNNTTVTVSVSQNGNVVAGPGITAAAGGGKVVLTMNAGDVAELVSDPNINSDLSGSLVQATCGGTSCPIEVFTGDPCLSIPENPTLGYTCDHVEEANFPAETLGKDYVVTVPTGPNAVPVGHLVRIYGEFNGTTLTYNPATPAGCPGTIAAGQVVECGVVTADFEVKGSQPFGVGSFMESGAIVDPADSMGSEGDPSESFTTAVEQYRTKYIFLAPNDYDYSFGDVVAPTGASLTLDGAAVTGAGLPLGSSGYEVHRIPLGPGQNGAHVLTATKPVGLQVMGYGRYTSYQYPGGLDLQQIAPPPPPVN